MRVVIAYRAIHFCKNLHLGNALLRTFQTRDNIGDFLAERRRTGRLTVCTRHHRHVCVGMCEFSQFDNDGLQRRQHHRVACALEHHSVRRIVDVFGRARKMDEFGCGNQFRNIFYLLLQPVLDRLHIVVGHRFNALDTFGIGFSEVGRKLVQQQIRKGRKRFDLGKAGIRQRLQPCDFDLDAMVHETRFR